MKRKRGKKERKYEFDKIQFQWEKSELFPRIISSYHFRKNLFVTQRSNATNRLPSFVCPVKKLVQR